MKSVAAVVLGWLFMATLALAAPITTYPAATTPYSGAEQILGTQPPVTGKTVNFTPAGLAAYTASTGTTGPYAGQVAQPLPAAYQPNCLTINSYLTQAQQAAVLAGTSTVDFSPILTAAIASHPAVVQGTNPICFGVGVYPFLSTVHINRATLLSGAGGGGAGSLSYGTVLEWPADTTGLVVDTAATSGSTDGSGTIIQDMDLEARPSCTSTTAYGIQMRGKSSIRNVSVGGFCQDQIHIEACFGCGGSIEGNDNGFLVDQVTLTGNAPAFSSTAVGVNCLFIQGADANAGTTRNVNCSNVKGWGIYDNGFLGSVHVGPEAATTGLLSRVNYSGTSYWANPGTTSTLLGSTTPGTNAAVWIAITAGSYPTWTNGGTYYPGGDYSSSGTVSTTLWLGAYGETGDPSSYGNQNSMTIGGLLAAGWIGPIADSTNNHGVLQVTNTPLCTAEVTSTGELQNVCLGALDVNSFATGNVISFKTGTNWPNTISLAKAGATGHDLAWTYPIGHIYEFWTGPSTTNTFGRSAIDPYANLIPSLVIADKTASGTNGRHLNTCNAAPTTTGNAVGEVCLNYAPAAGLAMGWTETMQGSPDTWTALPTIPLAMGTTGAITGTALTATCDSGTATVAGATVGRPVTVSATDGVDVGGAFDLRASVTSTNTVTVYICGTGTPASKAYNVRVMQ